MHGALSASDGRRPAGLTEMRGRGRWVRVLEPVVLTRLSLMSCTSSCTFVRNENIPTLQQPLSNVDARRSNPLAAKGVGEACPWPSLISHNIALLDSGWQLGWQGQSVGTLN